MKSFICYVLFVASTNCLPNPKPYKESLPQTSSLDSYGTRKSFSSLDFDTPSKLEYSETSAVAGHSDVGPKDVAAELHAKIEEAAQHALAIIDGAKTFAEEAEKEQV